MTIQNKHAGFLPLPEPHWGHLREAVHTTNAAEMLSSLTITEHAGHHEFTLYYIGKACAAEPYRSITTWFTDPAAMEMCKYFLKIGQTKRPEDLGNLAYLIMSSEWCDEWLAFAIDVLGHIDVGTVNLGDALHWWCGHWRVLHQRILDAGWECGPRHVWAFVAALAFGCLNRPLRSVTVSIYCDLTGDEMCDSWPQDPGSFHQGWDAFESDHPFDQVSHDDWMIIVDDKTPGKEAASTTSGTRQYDNRGFTPPAANAQKIRGHK